MLFTFNAPVKPTHSKRGSDKVVVYDLFCAIHKVNAVYKYIVYDNIYGLVTQCEVKIYMLFAGWEFLIVKRCDLGLENATRSRRPRAAFSSSRSQFFTIRTDLKPANNLFIFSCQKLAYKLVYATSNSSLNWLGLRHAVHRPL